MCLLSKTQNGASLSLFTQLTSDSKFILSDATGGLSLLAFLVSSKFFFGAVADQCAAHACVDQGLTTANTRVCKAALEQTCWRKTSVELKAVSTS
jgi:hypothetical protein